MIGDLRIESQGLIMIGGPYHAPFRRFYGTLSRILFRSAICVLVLLTTGIAAAQTAPPQETEKKEAKADRTFKPHLLLLPVISYSPETRLALGAGGILYYRLGQEKGKTRPSSLGLLMVYTMNNQIRLQLRPEIYLSNNAYRLNAVIRFERYPTEFFGIGDNVPASAGEGYTPQAIEFHLSLKRKILGSVFAGVQYRIEKTSIQKVTPGGLLAQGTIPGSTGGIISGLGLSVNWDNRDNIFFPRRGSYLQFSADFFNPAFGSDYHYSATNLDLRTYIPVFSTHVLAFQFLMRDIGGTAPFYELSTLGGASILRGNFSGQYRDKALLAVQAEYRLPVWRRFGADAFVGLGNVGPAFRDINLSRLKYSVGGGIRYRLDRQEGTNLRLDYGWGKARSGFYLTVQEAF
jgi:outer membrane protein assembly factor BamA